MNEKNERLLLNPLCNIFDVSELCKGHLGTFPKTSVEADTELILNHPNAMHVSGPVDLSTHFVPLPAVLSTKDSFWKHHSCRFQLCGYWQYSSNRYASQTP